MTGSFIPSQSRQVQPTKISEGPAPTFGEQIGAGFRTAKDDIGFVQDDRIWKAYLPVMEALQDKTKKSPDQYRTIGTTAYSIVNPFAGPMDAYDVDAMWADIQKYGIQTGATSREEFERKVLTRQGERAVDQRTLARGDSMIAPIIGGVGASVFDPVNMATAPFGGGAKSIGQAFLREAIINGGIEAVQQVPLAGARERMGEELTAKEAAVNIGVGGLFGGILGAGTYGIGKNWDAIKAAPKATQEAIWARIAPNLPEAMRPTMDWDALDDMLPDLAESFVGADNLSIDQKAAVNALRRDAEIAASNPFIPDGAGMKAHQEGLAEAMERILRDMPDAPASPRAVAPGAPLPRLRGGTSISSGVVAGDARSIVKSRIGIVESGGNNAAKNPKSSATGTYQFITGTWVKLYKSRYGDGGLTDAQIAAKRSDPRLQEVLMDDLMTINERSLQGAGHAADAGNMYLAHFAGPGGANKLLSADPNASARSVLGDRAVEANPFLKNMTAADVVQWAHRKMTGKGAPRGTGVVSRETGDPESDLRARLDNELAAIDVERARLDAEDEADATPIADLVDGAADELVVRPVDAPLRPIEPTARLPEAPPVEVLSIMPQLRELVRSREVSLNEPAKLAEALGVDEGQLRQGLMALALNREIRQNKKGQFMRMPRDMGPVDLLKFIGRAGGLSEDGLAPGARDIIDGSKGHRLGKGGRDYHKRLIPGSGPLVRKGGRSVEAVGELLHEAGYFGDPQGPRPSEAQVLELIDLAATQGRKIYPFGMTPEGRPVTSRNPWIDENDRVDIQRSFDREAEDLGFALDDEAFEAAARLYADGDYENVGDAIIDMLNREIEADIAAKFYELGDAFDEQRATEFIARAREDGFIVDEGFDGQAADAGNAGAVGTARGNVVGQSSQEGPTELNPETYRAFDDPVEGAGAAMQIASMEHDLRATSAVDAVITPDTENGNGWSRYQIELAAANGDRIEGTVVIANHRTGVGVLDLGGQSVNELGPAQVLRVARQLAKAAPELKTLTGYRISGARKAAGIPGEDASIDVQRLRTAQNVSNPIDPAIAERQAQQAALKAKSPMQAKVDQESTIGSPLFDAVDQYGFRLDAEGDVINPADLLAELDADAAVLKTIKDCL